MGAAALAPRLNIQSKSRCLSRTEVANTDRAMPKRGWPSVAWAACHVTPQRKPPGRTCPAPKPMLACPRCCFLNREVCSLPLPNCPLCLHKPIHTYHALKVPLTSAQMAGPQRDGCNGWSVHFIESAQYKNK